MARGGPRPNSGRPPGKKNKATIEREIRAQQAALAAAAMEDPEVRKAVAANPAAEGAGKRLGKQILDDFANVLAGMAAYYQPTPGGTNKNADEAKFAKYTALALYAADKVSQYQSPKLSAVMVGTSVVQRIKIEGGLPDLDQEPETIDVSANQPAQVEAPPMVQPAGAK